MITQGDCIELMKGLKDNSVDLVITDPPYQYLKHKLDIPFDEKVLFAECKRVLKKGNLVFFGRGISFYRWNLICNDLGFDWKEEIIWNKKTPTSPFSKVGRVHETISVFGDIRKVKAQELNMVDNNIVVMDYKRILSSIKNIKTIDDFFEWKNQKKKGTYKHGITGKKKWEKNRGSVTYKKYMQGLRLTTIINSHRDHYKMLHPTQKPVLLMRLLIRLCSDEGDLVLDPFAGSGSTALACIEENRRSINYEIDTNYFKMAENRINKSQHIIKQ